MGKHRFLRRAGCIALGTRPGDGSSLVRPDWLAGGADYVQCLRREGREDPPLDHRADYEAKGESEPSTPSASSPEGLCCASVDGGRRERMITVSLASDTVALGLEPGDKPDG